MPIDLKGKKYYQVAERLVKFHEDFEGYRIVPSLVHKDDRSVVMEVTILGPEGDVVSRGHAEGYYGNGDKVIEKTESVACGRALAFLTHAHVERAICGRDCRVAAAWAEAQVR